MSKHTPGPWNVDPDCWGDIQADGAEIATVFDSDDFGCEYLISGSITASEDEAKANARLIAAAPDLLAALSHLFDCLPVGDKGRRMFPTSTLHAADLNRALDIARAAISKAEGEQ